ncbi:uncharacterized protein LOC123592656 [Leopardus geoffroyi]|uniref:uncharacterized protein LOC123592656 n=1 Tax=Leopardus geoffroyi TaxID=46844 RepID=UPI001E26566E|nr:uncharacterized protein LOC123592656 [Leopardus geoffroyi]
MLCPDISRLWSQESPQGEPFPTCRRNQPMKSGNVWPNPDTPALQSCACAPLAKRAILDRGREWLQGGLGKQSLEMTWEGLLHRPGSPTGSWFTGPGNRTRSPRSQSPRSPGQEQKPVRRQSPTQGHRGPRRLCRQGWSLGRLLQGLESQQVTWDLCWDSKHLNRVSWFLLLLPTLFLPPPLFPCGFRPQIQGSKAFEGCFLYF